MYYLWNRYYDTTTMRFLNTDKILGSAGSEVGRHNVFAYCGNNPIAMVDPTGNCGIINLHGSGKIFSRCKEAMKKGLLRCKTGTKSGTSNTDDSSGGDSDTISFTTHDKNGVTLGIDGKSSIEIGAWQQVGINSGGIASINIDEESSTSIGLSDLNLFFGTSGVGVTIPSIPGVSNTSVSLDKKGLSVQVKICTGRNGEYSNGGYAKATLDYTTGAVIAAAVVVYKVIQILPALVVA